MNKIEELENKMLEIAQEIAELKKGQNAGESIESSEWRPKYDDIYWFVGINMKPNFFHWYSSEEDLTLYKYSRIFKTEEECQKYCDYRKALSEKSYKFSREEWESLKLNKYSIRYDHDSEIFEIDLNSQLHHVGKIYFKTKEDAQFMIDNYSDEMLKWGLL